MLTTPTHKIVLPKRKILLDQPRYLGDIIFVMAIAQKYVKEGYEVVFPMENDYYDTPIKKYFPNINFLRLNEFTEYKRYNGVNIIIDDKYTYLPLAESWARGMYQHMKNKYDFIGLPVDMWRNIEIKRDYKKECELMKQLNIQPHEKFNLINKNYGWAVSLMEYNTENNYRDVYMSKINGFSLFDWIGVIERAMSIHTVHTSIQYLLEILSNITTDLHIYPRSEIKEIHSKYDYLFKKEYKYH